MLKHIKLFFKKVFYKMVLLNNKRKTFISLELKGKVPRIRLHEKYEKINKWILRSLALIGILTSFISLSTTQSVLLSILLFAIEQFFERVIFVFTTMYVLPLPEFEYKPDEWRAMVYASPKNKANRFVVLIAFDTEEYARQLFGLIKSWNYDEPDDFNRNINLSFIIEDDESYSVYIYPSFERDSIINTKGKIEEDLKFEKYGKEHQQLIVAMTLCKEFPYSENSGFRIFLNHYNNTPLLLKPCLYDDGNLKDLNSDDKIIIHSVKIKMRSELTKIDYEYHHGKHVMYR